MYEGVRRLIIIYQLHTKRFYLPQYEHMLQSYLEAFNQTSSVAENMIRVIVAFDDIVKTSITIVSVLVYDLSKLNIFLFIYLYYERLDNYRRF